MYFREKTLDDLLQNVFTELLNSQANVKPTRGNCSEIIGMTLCLENPAARLSRTESRGILFSALGEFLWYMSADNSLEFIQYYISRYNQESVDGKIYGAYGPRLFNYHGTNQVSNVLNILRKKPSSRRAVIQLFDAEDVRVINRNEVPCTCTLQFLIRQGRLEMLTYMRSNDAYRGLPHDIFAFTMLQELLARTLAVELGHYIHMVGSMHLYETDRTAAQKYINLGYQSTKNNMPNMPNGNNWTDIKVILEIESMLRSRNKINVEDFDLTSYWADLARLLQIFSLSKNNQQDGISLIRKSMSFDVYDTFIEKRLTILQKNPS